MSSPLAIHALHLERNHHILFHDFSLTLNQGECVWLRGGNGCGKSSLLEAASGILPIDEGKIFWFGKDLAEAPKGKWHYLAHADGLKKELSIAENLYFQAALCAYRLNPEDFQAALKDLDLSHLRHTSVGKLSQGQKRRSALLHLRLLPFRPVWLLDEPFNALDKNARHIVGEWINQYQAQGGTVLFTHHFDLPEVLKVSRVINLGCAE